MSEQPWPMHVRKLRLKYAALLRHTPQRPALREAIKESGGETAKFDRLSESYRQEFQPRCELESRMVSELIQTRWRLDQVRPHIRPSLREIARYERRLLLHYETIFSDYWHIRRGRTREPEPL